MTDHSSVYCSLVESTAGQSDTLKAAQSQVYELSKESSLTELALELAEARVRVMKAAAGT